MAIYKSKKVTKDGRQYFFRIKYKDIFGETKDYTSKKYSTKKEAELDEAYFRINLGELCSTGSITINNAFNKLFLSKSKNLKQTTLLKIKNQFRYIEPIANTKINDLNLQIYSRWSKWFDNQKLCTINKNKILGLFREIIRYSNKYYNTNDTMLKYIENYKNNEPKKEMDFFTYDEYLQFQSVIDDPVDKLFFEMLYTLGLRQGEICSLKFSDIDFVNNTLDINKSITTKIKGEPFTLLTTKTKSSVRTLPLTNSIINQLTEQKNKAKEFNNYNDNWFIFGYTLPFKESTIQSHKNKYCDLANLRHIRIHDFRHSCASYLIHNGASIQLVSKWLGHSNISITLNTYTHLYKNELVEITNLLNKNS